MNRRDFLKGLLAGGATAAMTGVVLNEGFDLDVDLEDFVRDGEWHHIGVTRQAGVHHLFVDGISWGQSEGMPELPAGVPIRYDGVLSIGAGAGEDVRYSVPADALSGEDFTLEFSINKSEREPDPQMDELRLTNGVARDLGIGPNRFGVESGREFII